MNKQFLLKGKWCPGRGVRIRELTSDQRVQILETCAKEVTGEGPAFGVALRARTQINGICSMVTAITEKVGIKSFDELLAADLKWKPVSVEDLTDNLDKFFTAKEISQLTNIYNELHEVSDKELNDIMGEAQDVTEA